MADSKILDALKQLDVSNDDHWTEGKEPRMDVINGLIDGDTVTREQVNAEAEGFSRDTAAGFFMTTVTPPWDAGAPPAPPAPEASAPPPEPVVSEPAAPPEEDDAASPPTDGAEEEEETSEDGEGGPGGATDSDGASEQPPVDVPAACTDEISSLEAELEEIESELAELRIEKDDVLKKLEDANARADTLRERIEKLRPQSATQDTIQAYLASQKKLAEERGQFRSSLAGAGIKLKELQKAAGKAPIDEAMARKTGRGGRRPSLPRK